MRTKAEGKMNEAEKEKVESEITRNNPFIISRINFELVAGSRRNL
jgi:hypothetical protein